MEKIYKSLGCQSCESSEIETKKIYTDIESDYSFYMKDECEMSTRKIVNKCKCNNCGKEYDVDYGIERYIKFKKPYPLTGTSVYMYAIYETNDSCYRDYKIISVDNQFMIFAENDEYPIMLENKNIDETVVDVQKTKSLIHSTWMNRYR